MTQTYYPFDAGAGANVTEAQWREMARLWLPTGVIDGELNELAVSERAAGANLSVDVASGVAWVRGHYFKSDAVENLAISAAHATLGRIDRVIVRVDFTANTVALAVLEGTAAASPAAPSLTQNTSTWEISLAQVSVPATDTTIANAQITSERTIIKAPGFDHSTAPANGETWVYNSTTGLFEPGSSGTSLATDPLWNAAGDMAYASGADTGARLPIGTAGQVLKVNAGATAPEWAAAGTTVVSGSYTGNSTNDRTIPLAGTPKFVVITGASNNYTFFSTVNTGTVNSRIGATTGPSNGSTLTTNGFLVSGGGGAGTPNNNSEVFHYMAVI